MTPTLTASGPWLPAFVRRLAAALVLAIAAVGAHAQITARTPASTAGHGTPVAPTFVNAGNVAASGNAVAVGLPAGIAANDILLLFVETENQAATITNANGGTWTEITSSPQGTGTANNADAVRLTVFWSRYNGTQGNPTIGDSGDHQLARIIAVRGVATIGDPVNVTAGGVEAGNGDTSGSIPGANTTIANTFVVTAIATALPDANGTAGFTNWTNGNLTGLLERTDNTTSQGTGGGLGIATGVWASTGGYGNTTVTTSNNTAKAMISIALRPDVVSTIAINLPAGTVLDDVMVASIAFRTNSPGVDPRDITITAPAGWTLANPGRLDQLNSTGSALAVYTKVAGGAEPASYTWSFSCGDVSGGDTCTTLGFNGAAGGIVSFSGVDTANPVDQANGAPTGSATFNPATPSIVTTVPNTMLVTSHSVANAGTWADPPPSGMTQAYQVVSGAVKVQVSTALQASAGATGTKTANDSGPDAVDYGNAHILALRPRPPAFDQSAYRLFANADSTDVGAALAAQNASATLSAGGAAFRLRLLLHVSNGGLAAGGQAFKLQFAARSGTCDTAFAGETYADVTTTSAIAFNNNATPGDGANLTANAADPTHGADTVVNQTYEELNNFTSSSGIAAGQDGKWDFALIDNGAPGSTTYCFRVVKADGSLIDGYTVVPEITTARGTVFYFHDATTPNIGTLPGGTTISATSPDVTAAGAGTNRDMDQAPSTTAHVTATLNTLGQTTLQRNWFRRFVSRPLAAQTLPTGVWTIQAVALESNGASNMLAWGAVIRVWRPSAGAFVATLLDDPQLGATEPAAGGTGTSITTNTGSIAGVPVNEGDLLVIELWARNTQGNNTVRTNSIRYDGTTEGSTASSASYLQAPGAVFFHRGIYQSAYRLFNNADSTNVGSVLAAQDNPATLGSAGATFRLRKLLHVADINLGASGQAFKLQFAAKGAGTCAAPTGAYADVTAGTAIAFNNNPTPADGANLAANGSDPAHAGHTVVNQTYEELNNFTNAVAAINAGQDGKWDFALRDNGAPASATYCFRVVKDSGAVLDAYLAYPEVTTAAAAVPPDTFNAVEVSAGINGRIFTKLRGAGFTLDVVAIQGGVQYASFTDTVQVDLMANAAATTCAGGTPIGGTSQNVNLASGRGTTTAFSVATAYPDVRVRIQYPSASLTRCSSDNFSIKPTAFTITSTDATNLTTGTGATIKTGASFNLTAAGGAGYTGTPGTNFTGNVKGTPTAGTLGGSFGAASGGSASGSFFYGEVGHFGLLTDAVRDTSFTSVDLAGTDCVASSTSDTPAGGLYGCWVGSAAVAPVTGLGFGRFIPDNFDVAYSTPPIFGTVCGAFTYVGTRFTYPTAVMTVTARAGTANGLGNATTVNYAGSYAKLTTATLNQAPYNTKAARYVRFDALSPSPTPALDHTGLPDTATDPTVGAFANGVGTLTFGSGTGLGFVRDTAAPSAQFNADIALALNVIDEDAVAFGSNPASFGSATSGGGISFSGGKTMRYGRLRIANANGSPLVPLTMLMETQYWNGSSFVTNADDSCTSLGAASVGLGNYTSNLNSGETTPAIGGGFVKGRRMLTLSAPGKGNNGSVRVVLNLGTSTTIDTCPPAWTPPAPSPSAGNLVHLQGRWCGATHTKDPTARATFGAAPGAGEVIHSRELLP